MSHRDFDIFSDPWVNTPQGLTSLEAILLQPSQYTDVTESPLTKNAILRLLLAMVSVTPANLPVAGEMPLRGTADKPGFLQTLGLPEASARNPCLFLSVQDDNGAALTPVNMLPAITNISLAKALVTIYFCDRNGLKSRLPGLPQSGSRPTHMGQLVAWPWGDTLADFLELNAIATSSWVPWWKRPVDYSETLDKDAPDLVQYLMWPWRRLQVFPQGMVVVAGNKCSLPDPWAVGRASIRHISKGLEGETLPRPAIVIGSVFGNNVLLAAKEWQVAG